MGTVDLWAPLIIYSMNGSKLFKKKKQKKIGNLQPNSLLKFSQNI